ncbi:MAG: hypothetical protein MUF63_00095 [Rhodobacteraceae bacterium]|nr:hypothetical protein [Paracoccaceae bacterium]
MEIAVRVIGPRQTFLDHTGDWTRAREVRDSGCVPVRPDHHLCWRADEIAGDPAGDLRRVLAAVLAR